MLNSSLYRVVYSYMRSSSTDDLPCLLDVGNSMLAIIEKDRPRNRAVFYVSDVRKIILRREPSTAVHIQRAP